MKNLYMVQADHCYGDDQEKKRTEQLALVESLGLQEIDGYVFCNADQAIQLILGDYCCRYTIKSKVKLVHQEKVDNSEFQALLSTCIDKMQNAAVELFNARCSQEQPGMSLQNVDELKLMEDSCTDALQYELAEGWRILAIQPQPDQRRPDYILGRSTNRFAPRSYALRKDDTNF